MKRLISLFMALLIVAVLPVSAFAAEVNEMNNTAEGTIEYYVGSTYTVEIPEYIGVNSSASFNLSESNLAPNASITVTVANLPTDGIYTLNHTVYENTAIKVKLTSDYGDITSTDSILAVINYGDINSTYFRAELINEDNATIAAGAYRGTVNFVFTLNENYNG